MIRRLSIIQRQAEEPAQNPAPAAPEHGSAEGVTAEQLIAVLDPLLKDLDQALRGLRGTRQQYQELKKLYLGMDKVINPEELRKSFVTFQNMFTNLTNWKLQMRGGK